MKQPGKREWKGNAIFFSFALFVILLFAAPFVLAVNKTLTVEEGDLVKFKTKTVDIDGDVVVFAYSPPIDEKGEWQTTFTDAGNYTVAITASDGKSETKEEILLVVQNKNAAPVLAVPEKIEVNEGDAIQLNASVADPDNDKVTLTFSAPFSEKGMWKTGFTDAGEHKVTVTASDGEFNVSKEVKIIVADANRGPLLKTLTPKEATLRVKENQTIIFSVEAADEDNDALQYRWFVDGNEEAVVSTGAKYEHYFDFNSAGEHSVLAVVSDGKTEASNGWALAVENTNRLPVFELPEEIKLHENETLQFTLPATDEDGEGVTYSYSKPIEKDGTWQPDFESAGEYDITVTADDGNGGVVPKETTLIVDDVDRPPYFDMQDRFFVKENEEVEFEVAAADPDGDKVALHISEIPYDATFDKKTNLFFWKPGYDVVALPQNFFASVLSKMRLDRLLLSQKRDLHVLIEACGKDACGEKTVIVTVQNANRPPELDKVADVVVEENQLVELKPKAADADGDALKFTFTKPLDGNGRWQTGFEDAGVYDVIVGVRDGETSVEQHVTITVEDVNRPPTLNVPAVVRVRENELLTTLIESSDPDDDELLISVENVPTNATFDGHIFQWQPGFDAVQPRARAYFPKLSLKEGEYPYLVTFIAEDDDFKVKHDMVIVVTHVNRKPEIVERLPADYALLELGMPTTFVVKAEDPDGDVLTYAWDFGSAKATGSNVLQRTFTSIGGKQIKVTISDGKESVEELFVVSVVPKEEKPKQTTGTKTGTTAGTTAGVVGVKIVK